MNIFCEGYEPKDVKGQEGDLYLNIDSDDKPNNIRLILNNIKGIINKDELAIDLLRIASYVYIGDCQISRGGLKDPFDEQWNKSLHFYIPVLNPEFWNQKTIKENLQDTLSFLVGHKYDFDFSSLSKKDRKLFLDVINKKTISREPVECISMFSGGIDSLLSTVQLLEKKLHPLLLTHEATAKLGHYRSSLVEELNKSYNKRLTHWEIPISNHNQSAKENTQRSRGFLYAVIGLCYARCLGLKNVFLSDNGIVSFNLKHSAQNIGTLITRSTNPRFIEFVNSLSSAIWGNRDAPEVENSLLWYTKADVIKELKDLHKANWLSLSTSCAATMFINKAEPYCGVCSQCVDRRFAVEWNKLSNDEEPRFHYKVDIFRDNLADKRAKGIGKTHVENYWRKAINLYEMSDYQFLELVDDSIPSDIKNHKEFLEKAFKLHKRWSEQTIDAVQNFSREQLTGKLPEHSFASILYREGNSNRTLDDYDLPPKEKSILLNKASRVLHFKGQQTILTEKENFLLYRILKDPNNYVSFSFLMEGKHDALNNSSYAQTASTHRGNINRKIKAACVGAQIELNENFSLFETKTKLGYRLCSKYWGDFEIISS